jgi:peptide/nickel transport system substrate-binding protein
MNIRCLALCLLLSIACAPATAKLFRWSSQGDALSMDPHGQTEVFSDSVNAFAYEYLVARGKDFSIVPQLAISWSNPEPTRWILKLRKEVRFHDGTPFTADDVVFSLDRARDSGYRTWAMLAGTPRKLDDHTLELVTAAPNPVMLDTLAVLFIMSKSWCEKHGATRARDLKDATENHAVRHAMGTGPFKLVSYEPGVATRHVKNQDWWGIRAGLFEGNVESVEYRPMQNAASRMAALLAGQLDFVLDPPVQDLPRLREARNIRVWAGPEMRVTMLQLDQARDELLYSDVKGRNPFKDKGVRLALYQALDVNAIHTQVMRGWSEPTAVALPGTVRLGMPDGVRLRHPFDPERARQLLRDAGYPEGFGFTLHCPNDRWINDERLCTSVAAMWSRIGLKVKVEVMPKSIYLPKALKRDVSAALLAWGGSSEQAIFILKPVMRSPNEAGAGAWNFGGARNPELDSLTDRIEVETDPGARQQLVTRAARVIHEEIHVIPIHRQKIPWAGRDNVSVVHMPNNWLVPIWVKVN